MRYFLFVLCILPVARAQAPGLTATTAAGSATVSLGACRDNVRNGTAQLLLKGGDDDVSVSAELKLPPGNPTPATVVIPDSSMPKREPKLFSVSVTLSSCTLPASAVLFLRTGKDVLTFSLSFKASPEAKCEKVWAGWKSLALCGPPVLAGLIALILGWTVRDKLDRRMGSPKWDFGTSWATNVTLGGGVLGMVLGFSLFPENGHFLDKTNYLAASVGFSVLAALAPQAYNVFRKPENDPNDPTGMQLQGFVGAFVVAAGFTAWAAIGQAAITTLAIAELRCSGYLEGCIAWPLIVLLVLLIVGLVVYVVCTVRFTVEHQLDQATLTAARPDGNRLPIPNWYVP